MTAQGKKRLAVCQCRYTERRPLGSQSSARARTRPPTGQTKKAMEPRTRPRRSIAIKTSAPCPSSLALNLAPLSEPVVRPAVATNKKRGAWRLAARLTTSHALGCMHRSQPWPGQDTRRARSQSRQASKQTDREGESEDQTAITNESRYGREHLGSARSGNTHNGGASG